MDNSGSAFPYSTTNLVGSLESKKLEVCGLTKREWFAGMALQGILAKSFGDNMIKDAVHKAYEYADAMLKEGEGK